MRVKKRMIVLMKDDLWRRRDTIYGVPMERRFFCSPKKREGVCE